jgi:hypothetical protein
MNLCIDAQLFVHIYAKEAFPFSEDSHGDGVDAILSVCHAFQPITGKNRYIFDEKFMLIGISCNKNTPQSPDWYNY